MERRTEGGVNMFNAQKRLETIIRKYEQLQEKCKEYQAENESMRERIYKIEHGELCEGVYCNSCKNGIPGDVIELLTAKNKQITIGNETTCALSVPCPGFHRKE